MIGDIQQNEKGEILNTKASYQPPKEVVDLTLKIQADFKTGYDILNRPFEEFNNCSLIQRMNTDQKSWNAYVQAKSDDPDEEWRWNGTTNTTHNKIISMAAHLVSTMMYPGVFAQNDQDEEDKDMAEIMRYIAEWNIKNSDYEMSFLHGVIMGMVNPVSYINVDFLEVLQNIKEKTDQGKITKKEVVDEILSGLKFLNTPADEILIANAYQRYLQRQRFIIRRCFVDYDELKAIHGKHPNWNYIRPGVNIFAGKDGLFYEQQNDRLSKLGEKVIYYNRREDMQVAYVNGIYLGDADVDANPIKHRDNKNRPKYPYVKFGAEPISDTFYFYKSIAFKLINDQDLADQMQRMAIDGTILEVMTPTALIGDGIVASDIMFPGSVTSFPKDTVVQGIGNGRNIMLAWEAFAKTQQAMAESSQDDQRAGISGEGIKTAYEVARLEENAKKNLGIIGKMIIAMVKDLGELMIDRIVCNQTIAEIEELLGGEIKMKYRTFLLPGQAEGGKKITRKIMLDGSLIDKKMSEEQKRKEEYKLMEETGGYESETVAYKVNPQLFARLKYLIVIEPESWLPRNEKYEQLLKLETYDRLKENPLVDQEANTREFLLDPLTKGNSDRFILKNQPMNVVPGMPGATPKGGGSVLAELMKSGNNQNLM